MVESCGSVRKSECVVRAANANASAEIPAGWSLRFVVVQRKVGEAGTKTHVARAHEGIKDEARVGERRGDARRRAVDAAHVGRPRAAEVGALQVISPAVGLPENVRGAEGRRGRLDGVSSKFNHEVWRGARGGPYRRAWRPQYRRDLWQRRRPGGGVRAG
jgi:hypothetical protein